MKVYLDDPATVLWLQQALVRVVPTDLELTGVYDIHTRKEVIQYQARRFLTKTGVPDDATVEKLEQELAQPEPQRRR